MPKLKIKGKTRKGHDVISPRDSIDINSSNKPSVRYSGFETLGIHNGFITSCMQSSNQSKNSFSNLKILSLNHEKKSIWKESNKPLKSLSPANRNSAATIQVQLVPKGLPKVVTASIRQIYEERKQNQRLSMNASVGSKEQPLIIVKSIQQNKY